MCRVTSAGGTRPNLAVGAPVPESRDGSVKILHTTPYSTGSRAPAPTAAPPGARPQRRNGTCVRPTGSRAPSRAQRSASRCPPIAQLNLTCPSPTASVGSAVTPEEEEVPAPVALRSCTYSSSLFHLSTERSGNFCSRSSSGEVSSSPPSPPWPTGDMLAAAEEETPAIVLIYVCVRLSLDKRAQVRWSA